MLGPFGVNGTNTTAYLSIDHSIQEGDSTYLSIADVDKGARDTFVYAFWRNSSNSRAFGCTNHISQVGNYDQNAPDLIDASPLSGTAGWAPQLQLPDEQAKILAGAIGW